MRQQRRRKAQSRKCQSACIKLAEFGQLGDEGARDGWPYAGHRGEQVFLLAPGRRAAHGIVDVGVEAGELQSSPSSDIMRSGMSRLILWATETALPGWAGRTRTQKCRRKLSF